ncbi:MAG TPA: glycosyltransferase family 4 protein [Casimicrobiaceae bacterium]|nr:glycosyltransferase family 4 protein [Casimicrobiaceae bacterium]
MQHAGQRIVAADASRAPAPVPDNVNSDASRIAGMRPFGFNVIGYASSNIGLGESARNVIRLILGRGFPVAVLDCDAGYGRSGHETCFREWTVDSADRLPYGITIAVLSLTSLPQSIVNGPVRLRSDVVTAGFLWWELPFIPHKWAASLEYFDVLLSGSNFTRSALESHVRRVRAPIIDVMHAPCDPPDVQPCRSMFDLPGDKVVFLCTLDPRSDPNRKNPYSAIAAFLRAFNAEDRAHLVIKVNNGNSGGSSAVELAALGGIDQRSITIIDRVLPRTELLQLFASCDVFVGLHRAEGFGYGLMEAMALGKPVIATGWSGNMTFMNQANSCVVGYRLVPVDGSVPAYSRGVLRETVHWAEPDIAEAATWMRRLASDPGLRDSIGERAVGDIERYRAKAERAEFLDELERIWRWRAEAPRTDAPTGAEILDNVRRAELDRAGTIDGWRLRTRSFLDRHLLWRFAR